MIEFRSVEDYCWELREENESIEPRIVRLTREYKPATDTPFWLLSIIATHRQHGELVRMRYFIGSITMPPAPVFNSKPEATAVQLLQQISDVARELNLVIRRGAFVTDAAGKEE